MLAEDNEECSKSEKSPAKSTGGVIYVSQRRSFLLEYNLIIMVVSTLLEPLFCRALADVLAVGAANLYLRRKAGNREPAMGNRQFSAIHVDIRSNLTAIIDERGNPWVMSKEHRYETSY